MNIITIPITEKVINNEVINECIYKYKEIKNNKSPSHLNIVADIAIENDDNGFEFSLIGHFILFKEDCPELTISLIFNDNFEYSGDPVIWKLKQQMIHAYYSTGKDIFTLVDGNGKKSIASIDKQKIIGHFVLSEKFLPITYLNKTNYEILFKCSMKYSQLTKLDILDKTEDGLYKACKEFLLKQVSMDNYLHILSQLAFYKALQKVNILRYYLYDELKPSEKNFFNIKNKEDFQIGKTQNIIKKQEYWNELLPLFDEIKKSPLFRILLFFTFITSELFLITEKDLDTGVKNIKLLWEFIKDFVYGIEELAKNILEHTNTKKGIITGIIKQQNIELSVFDYGDKGIMDTFKDYLLKKEESTINNNERELLKEDIESIENKYFNFNSFFFTTTHILNEQANRATAHLGLLFFAKLISHNSDSSIEHPLKVISSNSITEQSHCFPDDINIIELPKIGTYFKITLALIKEQKYKPYKLVEIPEGKYFKMDRGIEFFKFTFTKEKEKKGVNNIYSIEVYPKEKNQVNSDILNTRELEDIIWKNVVETLGNTSNEKILCIDFCTIELTGSQLFRFLAKFAVEFVHIHLIIFNIRTQLLFELKKINDCYFEVKKEVYWNENKAILFFSYVNIRDKLFYFTDIFWGKTKDDFDFLNLIISHNHFNSITKEGSFGFNNNKYLNSNFNNFPYPYFDNDGNLFHFNLLIEDSSFKPLFNHNAETLLQNNIRGKVNKNEYSSITSLIADIENMQAYKIPDSHFRLGVKIHINDFFYAKPFFQNSFFAFKYALLITYDIIHSIQFNEIIHKQDNLNENGQSYMNFEFKDGITVIGYGLYSELIVCYIKEFLDNFFKLKNINIITNTNTVTDSEDYKLNKPVTKINPIHNNVLIIIPIASTFSTSIKIKNMLNEEFNSNLNIIEPFYNIFTVFDKSFPKLDNIFISFGWNEIDIKNKIVKTSAEQKFYLYHTTDWYKIDNCKKCFPPDEQQKCINSYRCLDCSKNCVIEEEPLFVTDKTSLTPELILGMPKARKIENNHRKLILTETSVKKGHVKRNKNHYRYYFNDDVLWETNRNNIMTWLSKINIDNTAQSVILAPGHFSNASFVEMVNKISFKNRAIILHYDPNIENTQNFEIFYRKTIGLEEKEIKIYFIDDVITSGNAFFIANSLLKRIIFSRDNKNITFEACFFCVNRMNYYDYKDLKTTLGNGIVYSFIDLHSPYIKSINSKCPLCDELKKYKKLYKNSYLTRIKLHFLKEQKKLKKTGINIFYEEDSDGKIYRRMEAIHRIYSLFSIIPENLEESFNMPFDKWVKYLIDNTTNPFIERKSNIHLQTENIELGNTLTETEISVLKCLTESPFYNYKYIREKTFKWVLKLLENAVFWIKENFNTINKNTFMELKMLIRRATLLNSNYIISYKFFHLLKLLYFYVENKMTSIDEIKINRTLLDFSIFYVAQVNELLYKDEARCKELSKRLYYFIEISINSKYFKQLIRMLHEENAANLRVFTEIFENLFQKLPKKKRIINSFIENRYEQIKKDYQYFSLNFEDDKIKKLIQMKLEIKKYNKNNKTEDKIYVNEIYKKINILTELIDIDMNKGGCFVILRYKQTPKTPFYLLYNEGTEKKNIEKSWVDYHNFMEMFILRGQCLPNSFKNISIIEFHNEGTKWKDLFSDDLLEETNNFSFLKNNNRLLLLRIDRDELNEYFGQAVIGFYFNAIDTKPTKVEILHYLLLLRGDISKYLSKLVEGNDSFRDWVEEQEYMKEIMKSDHDYNKMMLELWELYNVTNKPDIERYDYIHSILEKRENIKRICVYGGLEKENDLRIEHILVEDEINKACKIILSDSSINFNIKNMSNIELSVDYPLFVFRSIVYEYVKNVHNQIQVDKPENENIDIFLYITLKNINNAIEITMENNTKHAYDELSKYRDNLYSHGYKIEDLGGLNKNNRLLVATKCKEPNITISELDHKNIFKFKIEFRINSYE